MKRQDSQLLKTRPKVFVGMSGGVDSSVSAALLKKRGYEVTGVFIKVWQPDWIECTWREDRRDAMRAAAHLGIPFVTIDLEKEYKQDVVDYMIEEYKAGRTPNPDVMCNRSVKFGGFFDWALRHGADYVATGHYARIVTEDNHRLLAGIDPNKDQSYFLWTLTADHLSKTFFPVGDMEKADVRKFARKFGLPNAEKKDSQGLCFIGKVDIKNFLSHYIEPRGGRVLDVSGKVIGEHNGASFYTIGERHGFNIVDKTPHDEPLYVIAKDVHANTITVSPKSTNGELPGARTVIGLCNTVFNQGYVPIGKQLSARTRYRAPLQSVMFKDDVTVVFEHPQSTISPGQSLVVYDGEQCLGGGIIV